MRQLAEIALKLWAIILVVSAALAVPSVVSQYFLGDSSPSVDLSWRIAAASNSVHVLLKLVAAIAIFKFARRISERLVEEDAKFADVRITTLQRTAFGVLGLYFFVLGLRQCAGLVFQLATKPEFEPEKLSYLWRNASQGLVEAGVQTIAGLILFFGRNGLTRAWRRVRGIEGTTVSPG